MALINAFLTLSSYFLPWCSLILPFPHTEKGPGQTLGEMVARISISKSDSIDKIPCKIPRTNSRPHNTDSVTHDTVVPGEAANTLTIVG